MRDAAEVGAELRHPPAQGLERLGQWILSVAFGAARALDEGGDLEAEGGEALFEVVMELAADAPALVFLGVEQPAGQSVQLVAAGAEGVAAGGQPAARPLFGTDVAGADQQPAARGGETQLDSNLGAVATTVALDHRAGTVFAGRGPVIAGQGRALAGEHDIADPGNTS